MENSENTGWVNNKTLVFTWFLFFFPVGLYALWVGQLYKPDLKSKITGGVILAVIILYLLNLFGFVHLFIMVPLGLYLCWKDPAISNITTYKFAAGAVLILVFYGLSNSQTDHNFDPQTGSSCSATIVQGDCTYFRDDNCNVIGKQCN